MTTIPAPPEWVESVGQLRFPERTERRMQYLMDRNNEGQLSLLRDNPREPLEREAAAIVAGFWGDCLKITVMRILEVDQDPVAVCLAEDQVDVVGRAVSVCRRAQPIVSQ